MITDDLSAMVKEETEENVVGANEETITEEIVSHEDSSNCESETVSTEDGNVEIVGESGEIKDIITDDEAVVSESEMINPTPEVNTEPVDMTEEFDGTSEIETAGEVIEPVKEVIEKKITEIPLTNFHAYLTENWKIIPDLNFQKISADGVNPSETISFTLPDLNSKVNTDRKMYHFSNAHLIRVPNLPLQSFKMLNDRAFKLTQIIIPDVLYLKSYSSGNILFSCLYLNINNQYLPIENMRVKKKSDELKFDFEVEKIDETIAKYQKKLTEIVNSETVVILYHQSATVQELFTTYQSVVDWFNLRISKIRDIHHLLQIDGVLIRLFNE